jgi:hypothetical protein
MARGDGGIGREELRRLAADLFNRVWELLDLPERSRDEDGAYEGLVRAHAVAGDRDAARRWLERAREATRQVAEEDDREVLAADLDQTARLI